MDQADGNQHVGTRTHGDGAAGTTKPNAHETTGASEKKRVEAISRSAPENRSLRQFWGGVDGSSWGRNDGVCFDRIIGLSPFPSKRFFGLGYLGLGVGMRYGGVAFFRVCGFGYLVLGGQRSEEVSSESRGIACCCERSGRFACLGNAGAGECGTAVHSTGSVAESGTVDAGNTPGTTAAGGVGKQKRRISRAMQRKR